VFDGIKHINAPMVLPFLNDNGFFVKAVKVKVTKPLPTGRQAFRLSVTVTCKELKDDKRSLLLTIRASLP
jgi:hypothetical protein